ncbi:MAG: response regulator transcription factor [Dehalococcoidia bacterium]|nr:response regulator transcription factor [Dehalococcoidia bacterium]
MVNKVRVFIADSQQLFRQGVRASLGCVPDIEICGEAPLSTQLIAEIESAYPLVVLLGISSETDIEVGRSIKQRLPGTSVVILTDVPDDNGLYQAIRARAAAYLGRQVTPEQLIEVIRRAARGEHPINDTLLAYPRVAEKVLRQFQDLSWGKGVEEYVSPLTPRETQILTLMAQGYLNKQIAAELCLSEQTIKNHVTSILRKLDANARTQAVINAIKRGLIDVRDSRRSAA